MTYRAAAGLAVTITLILLAEAFSTFGPYPLPLLRRLDVGAEGAGIATVAASKVSRAPGVKIVGRK